MCRLFGMMSSGPTAATFWLLSAPDSVLDQSYKNADGTGLAYYDAEGRATVDKQPITAYQDRGFAAEARHVRSHLFVSHVRHAASGGVSLENTQPFAEERLVFAHNGTIEGLDDLPFPVGPFRGDTDSERYFTLLRHYVVSEARDTLDGIKRTVDWIRSNRPYSSLNFLLADGERLYALRYPDDEDLYVRRLDAGEDLLGPSSYGTRTEARLRHGAYIFASERLDEADSWEKLEPGTLAVAHHEPLRLDLHHI